jgi:hypothetical protein
MPPDLLLVAKYLNIPVFGTIYYFSKSSHVEPVTNIFLSNPIHIHKISYLALAKEDLASCNEAYFKV